MIIFKSASTIKKYIIDKKNQGITIGFVPTMGALHEGHISLVNDCKKRSALAVASIFVNPTQFNNSADFDKYPITIAQDIDMLEKSGCDILFYPSHEEIYPDEILKSYHLGYLETIMEGKYRPGHFQGVCQVVERLLEIVQPNDLYLGQKDYQQCLVIKELVKILKIDIQVHINETVREKGGLAMSSRNKRLNMIERTQASKIYQALYIIKMELKPGNLMEIKNKAIHYLEENKFKVDYVEVADAVTLRLLDQWDGTFPVVILTAAYLNEVRLIDNLVMKPGGFNSSL